MKIKSIYIDGLHNAKNKTYEFSDLVYLFGHNGAGKSTVLQAIQLALLGYIPGTAKNSKEALLRHSPKGAIEVRLILSEGSTTGTDIQLERKITSAGNKLTTFPDNYDLSTVVEGLELPIFNFDEFMGQTANKLKEYFIKHILPNTDGELNWDQILRDGILNCNFPGTDAIVLYGKEVVGEVSGDLVEQVATANERFKAEQTYIKSELQRLQSTLDSLIYYDDYTGPTNLEELKAEQLSLGALRDQLLRYNAEVAAQSNLVAELQNLQNHYLALGGPDVYDYVLSSKEESKFNSTKLSQELSDKKAELAEINAKIKATDSLINSQGICPYTERTCDSIQSRIEQIRTTYTEYKAEALGLTSDIGKLSGDLNDVISAGIQLDTKISEFNRLLSRIDALQSAAHAPETPITDKTVGELDAAIDDVADNISKLTANLQYNQLIDNITKNKYDLELKNQALSDWIKHTSTNGLQTTLMQTPFNELANKMTQYIQHMYGNDALQAHFNISTKANSFSFGLIRNDTYIPYDLLSSGEKCLYALALMICIVSNNSSPLKLLLCDDMFDHLDDDTVESTFNAIKQIKDVQFIFAGVKHCSAAKDVLLTISD